MQNRFADQLRENKVTGFIQAMHLVNFQCQLVMEWDDHLDLWNVERTEELRNWCYTALLARALYLEKGHDKAIELFLALSEGEYRNRFYRLETQVEENFSMIYDCLKKNNYAKLALPEKTYAYSMRSSGNVLSGLENAS